MSRKPCEQANPNCKYWGRPAPPELKRRGQENGCYSDLDHIVPRRLGCYALAAFYITQVPENKQQLCRAEHDLKTAMGDEPLPTDEYMREAIREAEEAGLVSMSANQRRKLFPMQEVA